MEILFYLGMALFGFGAGWTQKPAAPCECPSAHHQPAQGGTECQK